MGSGERPSSAWDQAFLYHSLAVARWGPQRSISASCAAWNSIIYANNGIPVPMSAGLDLSGFRFPPFATGGLVNFSDFCGYPWGVTVPCGSNPPTMAGCISVVPDFVNPAAPNFVLRCGGGGTPGPCTPTCLPAGGSRCIDAGDPTGPGAPAMPLTDANGAPRAVGLNSSALVPDMGAVEKQTCSP